MQWRELEPGDSTKPNDTSAFQWADLPIARPVSEASAFLRDCALLGVGAAYTVDELHAAYRALVLQHHPDRADEADRPAAEERLKAINAAYRDLRSAARTEAA